MGGGASSSISHLSPHRKSGPTRSTPTSVSSCLATCHTLRRPQEPLDHWSHDRLTTALFLVFRRLAPPAVACPTALTLYPSIPHPSCTSLLFRTAPRLPPYFVPRFATTLPSLAATRRADAALCCFWLKPCPFSMSPLIVRRGGPYLNHVTCRI
jgi:hypothetical protein